MLDDLIRAALLEAAQSCGIPEEIDQLVWSRILEGGQPASGGTSDG